jgi:hypothetical protein
LAAPVVLALLGVPNLAHALDEGYRGYGYPHWGWNGYGNEEIFLWPKYYPKFFNLKSAIANYYRTRHFKLDITKYLFRNDS